MSLDLPHDIWLLIVSFVTKNHHHTLISVNRALYNIVLDARYNEIQWIKLDKRMLWTLDRLQNPEIARRVRRLHIRAWFIQYLLNSESMSLSVDTQSQSQLSKWTSKGLSTASERLSVLKKSVAPTPAATLPRYRQHNTEATPVRLQRPALRLGATLFSSSSVVNLMLDAFRRMVNLMEFKLEWRDLPLTKYTRAFLCRADPNHLSGLHKLVIHAQLPQFHDLLSRLTFKFSGLQELELYFEYNTPSTGAPTAFDITRTLTLNQTILSSTIAPFVATLRSSLSSLTISSSAECDHSHLFNSLLLYQFPRLRSLSVCIPFDTDHLSDTRDLIHLLQVHACTLLHLELRPTGGGETASGGRELEAWSTMNQACLRPSPALTFAHLESLTIPVLDVREALQLVRRSSDTLKKLCLLGRFLDEDEVKEVVDIFASRGGGVLRSLSINVKNLIPRLIDILAWGLPALWGLSLVLEQYNEAFLQLSSSYGFQQQVGWGLYDLSVYVGRYRDDRTQSIWENREHSIMIRLMQFLPSVRSIKGQGTI